MELSYIFPKKNFIFLETELSKPSFQNILLLKKVLIFSQKKFFLIFWEMELSSLKINKILIFLQESFSYILGNETFLKNLLYFRRELSKLKKYKNHSEKIYHILGNETF